VGVTEVSVYVPAYNAAPYLARALESLLAQTVPPAEVIVVDDGSVDATREIAESYPVRVVRHDENRGLGAARNTGFRSARHELVATIDADSAAHADWLERLLPRLDGPRMAGGGGALLEQDAHALPDRWRKARMEQHWGSEPLLNPPFVFGSNTIFKKAAVEDVGGYDERCRRNCEDGDLSERLRLAGYETFYEPQAVVEHLRHDSLRSVLDTFWWWQWGFETEGRSLRNLAGVFAKGHLGRLRSALTTDVRRRDWALVPLDLAMVFWLTYRDLRLYVEAHSARH
jgi:glycosyltransferase involved in cell wall biosynthesis